MRDQSTTSGGSREKSFSLADLTCLLLLKMFAIAYVNEQQKKKNK
jgi:hypothetical protein